MALKPRRTTARPPVEAAIEWPRAEPAALVGFDPNSKWCTMNCGKHALDPRSEAERKFLCDECAPYVPSVHEQLRAALAREAALRAELAELKARYA